MKRKNAPILVAVSALTLLIVALLVANGVRRTSHIHLPEESVSQETENGEADGSAIGQIAVTPETVQRAIATLRRPESYTRSVTVEQIWSGGSGTQVTSVHVMDGWTRLDTQLPDETLRHLLTDGETTHIWYGAEKTVYTGAAGGFTADAEQSIPTYEDVLELEVEDIVKAGYRSYADTDCIYVESALDSGGTLRCWVSVSDGLLTAAEKYEDGTLVYRMTATAVGSAPLAEQFTLPDGTSVLTD